GSQFNSNHGEAAIYIDGSNWLITDCDVSNNSGQGLFTLWSAGSIKDSRFEGNDQGGVLLTYVFNPIVVSDTLIVGDGVGVDVFFRTPDEASEVVLLNSTIVSSGDRAIHVTGVPLGGHGQVKIFSSTVQGDVIEDLGISLTSFNSIIDGS